MKRRWIPRGKLLVVAAVVVLALSKPHAALANYCNLCLPLYRDCLDSCPDCINSCQWDYFECERDCAWG